MFRRVTRLVPAAIAAAAVLGLLATGASASSSKKDAARIRRTVALTNEQGSARVSGQMSLSATGVEEVDGLTATFEGVAGFDGRRGEFTFDMSTGGQSLHIEERIIGGVAYMKIEGLDGFGQDEVSGLLSGGWIKVDLADLLDPSAAGTPGADPSGQLDALRGVAKGSVDKVGKEDVRGVETTHYRATIDLEKAIELAPAKQRAKLRDSFEQLGDATSMPVDVWIDRDGVTRRLDLSFELEASGEQVKMTMSYELYDFGVEVDVQAPPADEVMDLGTLEDLADLGDRPRQTAV